MDRLITAVLTNIDIHEVQEDLDVLSELNYTLEEIKEDIDAIKPAISFWDKVNVFTSTEQEEELKGYKSELRSHQSLRKHAVKAIKNSVRAAIDRTYVVRLKLQLSDLEQKINDMSANCHGGSNNFVSGSISGRGRVLKMLRQIDDEFCERFDLETGGVEEHHVVNAVFSRLLNRSSN